jgi:uncharacterized membrane protein (UPF0127 family)
MVKSSYSKHKFVVLFIAVAVLIFGFLLLRYFNAPEQVTACSIALDGQCIELERAETGAQHIQGLSGRPDMDDNRGMLFVFPEDDFYCMYMKDMNFSLDMVWLSSGGEVVHIEENVTPETYPEQFCSPVLSRYVIELKAGVVDRANIEAGQSINL